MSRYAERVAAPRAKAGPTRQRTPPVPLPRPPLSHVLQLRAAQSARAAAAPAAASRGGLPAPLKAGIEQLSGIAMDDVRVHRNSAAPAKLGALAYAQGSDIHLGPGQERNLPHEAWHVVQQKQGRVRPTLQMKDDVSVNDDLGLEREADVMGARAARDDARTRGEPAAAVRVAAESPVRQMAVIQLQAAPLLRAMKARHDQIKARVPQNHAVRLAILADVPAYVHRGDFWTAKRQAAQGLWNRWSNAYQQAEAGQQPNYPAARVLATDSATMEAHYVAFRPAAEHLIDHGLVAVKRALALKYYLKAPGMPNAFNDVALGLPNETLNQLKLRLRAIAQPHALPGANGWRAAAGYAFNAQGFHVTPLAALNGTAIHWSVNNDQIHGLDQLRTTRTFITIRNTLIPNNGFLGVHVTLERYGANHADNPRAFGRPAGQHRNLDNLPNGVTANDLNGRLNAENNRLGTVLLNFTLAERGRIRLAWDTH